MSSLLPGQCCHVRTDVHDLGCNALGNEISTFASPLIAAPLAPNGAMVGSLGRSPTPGATIRNRLHSECLFYLASFAAAAFRRAAKSSAEGLGRVPLRETR